MQVAEAAGIRGVGFLGVGGSARSEAQRKQAATLAAGISAAVQVSFLD